MFLSRVIVRMVVLVSLLVLATGTCRNQQVHRTDRPWTDDVPTGALDPSGRAFGSPPSFEDYAVSHRYRGTPAAPDLASHPDAPRFAAALERGVLKGPNFAGRFTIVTWSCGRLCREFVIVDAETGAIHPGLTDAPPFTYHLESRLIVIEGPPPLPGRVPCAGCSANYYVWQDDHLELIPLETWVGAALPPPSMRSLIDSLRNLERPFLDGAGPSVLRPSWDRLVFAARDGSRLVLGDRLAHTLVEQIHVFLGFLEPIDHYLVRTIMFEGNRFGLVDAETGRLTDLDAPPVVSPDGSRFLTTSLDLVAGHTPNRIRIYRMTAGGPEVEWSLEPSGWGAAHGAWVSNERIALDSVSGHGGRPPSFPGTRIELLREGHYWRRVSARAQESASRSTSALPDGSRIEGPKGVAPMAEPRFARRSTTCARAVSSGSNNSK